LTLFADVRFSPLNVTDLARLIRLLVAHPTAAGVVNAGAADEVSKEAFGRIVASELALDAAPIEPIALADAGLRAPRPRNTALAVERVTDLLGAPPPTVRAGVRRLREELESGVAARLKGRPAGTLRLLFEDA
jgi:dTDP-4-dehydrorhamnose reductase